MDITLPALETSRLLIRRFVSDDIEAVHRIMATAWHDDPNERRRERGEWLNWTIASYRELEQLKQPPYGERAVCLKGVDEMVGIVGLVPSLGPFGQLPGFPSTASGGRSEPQVGLFWTTAPEVQGRGYATEAAQALIAYAFTKMKVARIVATTEFDNEASMGVMRKLGMTILRNPLPEPHWFQVVGLLEVDGESAPY